MRNGGADDVVGEALAGEITSGFRRRAAASDDALRPFGLALEGFDRGLCGLRVDPGEQELMPDALVPRSPVGEGGCS